VKYGFKVHIAFKNCLEVDLSKGKDCVWKDYDGLLLMNEKPPIIRGER
jgi:hypothetical protein